MDSENVNLPFFPKYETELSCSDKVRITWFETNFSQLHYNVQNKINRSNACTLIAVMMANKYYKSKVKVKEFQNYCIYIFLKNSFEN